ncbi:MAG: single-stranded DNA-binding protein, partial [Eubacteriales bacterium]
MASLNKVILIGHLTADPELKQTPSGVSVTS